MSRASKFAIATAVVLYFVVSGIALTNDARAADGPSVGMVTKVENQAQVGGVAAAVGSIVHMKDTLSTGAKARMQVTFRDQSNLSLGENATVVVDRFVFDPDASIGQATLNATKGAFRFATGKISEMTKKDINVQTPYAALAVRGTDFWGGRIQGQYGVLLVSNSRLEVRKGSCGVTLDQAGQGTDIDGGCPGAKYQWPPEKVDAALSMTSFSIALGPTQALPAVAGAAAAAAGFGVSSSNNNNNNGPPPQPPPQQASP